MEPFSLVIGVFLGLWTQHVFFQIQEQEKEKKKKGKDEKEKTAEEEFGEALGHYLKRQGASIRDMQIKVEPAKNKPESSGKGKGDSGKSSES